MGVDIDGAGLRHQALQALQRAAEEARIAGDHDTARRLSLRVITGARKLLEDGHA